MPYMDPMTIHFLCYKNDIFHLSFVLKDWLPLGKKLGGKFSKELWFTKKEPSMGLQEALYGCKELDPWI